MWGRSSNPTLKITNRGLCPNAIFRRSRTSQSEIRLNFPIFSTSGLVSGRRADPFLRRNRPIRQIWTPASRKSYAAKTNSRRFQALPGNTIEANPTKLTHVMAFYSNLRRFEKPALRRFNTRQTTLSQFNTINGNLRLFKTT